MWISGFENRYEITKDGKVFFHKNNTKNERKLVSDKDGYLTVNLKIGKKVYCKKVHRLVAEHFIKGEGETVNHKNGIKTDNRVENLEWCSNKYNVRHGVENFKPRNVGYKNNSSGYCNVQIRSKRFRAMVTRNNIRIHLGSFNTPEEAFSAVLEFDKQPKKPNAYKADYSKAKL